MNNLIVEFSQFALRCPKCKTYGVIALDDMTRNFVIEKKGKLIKIKCLNCQYEELWDMKKAVVNLNGEEDGKGKLIWRGGFQFHPL